MIDNLIPILIPEMITELNLSYVKIGIMQLGYRIISGFLQLFMGFLGKFVKSKIILGLGVIWQSIANSLVSISPNFELIFMNRTLAGIGTSPHHPVGSAYIAKKFPKKKIGRAFGINISIAQIGTFITPIIGTFLVFNFGWRLTLLAFSIPGLIIGITFLLVKEKDKTEKWTGFSSFISLFKDAKELFRDKTILMILIVEMAMVFRVGTRNFLPSYFRFDLGMETEYGLLLSVFIFPGIFAPYLWGYLSDKIEKKKIIISVMLANAILWLLLPYVESFSSLILTLICLGVVGQGLGGVLQAIVAEATPLEKREVIFGVYFAIAYTFGSFSPVILGYLADTYSFQASFTYITVVSLIVSIAAFFLKTQKK